MQPSALLAGAIFLAALLAGSIAVYTLLLFSIFGSGGKVSAQRLGLADLFIVVAIAGLFIALLLGGRGSAPREIDSATVVIGIALFGFIAAALAAALRLRGIRLREFFGVRRVGPLLVPALGLGLILAAYPLIATAGALSALHLGFDAQPQDMILFFKAASARRDYGQIIVTIFAAAVCAPVIEEVIFRGYLYPALKRWTGILPAMLGSAALFAAIHNNVFALGPIFVLALCLAAAYEATGSLLVPMAMHAIFNTTSLVLLLFVQQPTA